MKTKIMKQMYKNNELFENKVKIKANFINFYYFLIFQVIFLLALQELFVFVIHLKFCWFPFFNNLKKLLK